MLTYAIDFGTSNSILGAASQGRSLGFAPLDPHAPAGADPAILRSLLYFPSAQEVFYGARAIEELVARDHAGRFIRSIKRQLPSRTFVGTYVDNRPFNLEDLIGIFLGEIRRRANAHFGADVTSVVLGRPARFAPDDADDRFAEGRLERAARIAGFTSIEFFPEPVAAALGYRGSRTTESVGSGTPESLVLAADYGGGTSDFTVYRMGAGPFDRSHVLGMGGVSLAGDAIDAALMRRRISTYFGSGVRYKVPFGSNLLTMPANLMERICHPGEISLLRKQDTQEFLRNVRAWSLGPDDRARMDRLFTLLDDQLGFPLFERIEGTKRALSAADRARFEYHYPGIDIDEPVTRSELEDYSMPAFEKITEAMDDTLRMAGIDASRIDQVLLTGGTAKTPWIRRSLEARFGADKCLDLDPFRGVAQGLVERARELG